MVFYFEAKKNGIWIFWISRMFLFSLFHPICWLPDASQVYSHLLVFATATERMVPGFFEIQGVDLREVCEIHISGQWGSARNNPLDKLRFIRFSLA